MIDYTLVTLGVLNLAGLCILWVASSHPQDKPRDTNRPQRPASHTILKPFAKPSGKNKPKVNDDRTAWEIENER